MAKLRHIAMVVEEMEQTAQFYEKSFGMARVRQTDTAIGLSDGVVSLVIIHPSNVNMKGDDRRGLHHLGFLVEDVDRETEKVEAVGAGKIADDGKRIPLDVKSGDRILFGKYSGNEVKIDGDDYLILREEDVLAILE